jgi:hypothetical protein
MRRGTSAGTKQTRAAQPPYKSRWPVVAATGVADFQLVVPTLEEDARCERIPEFVRLHVRGSGLGKLAPRPVLHRSANAGGGAGKALAVPVALKELVANSGSITVTSASAWAFRWYRLRRSGLAQIGTCAIAVGALVVALGALRPRSGNGQGLLIAGAVLTLMGIAAVMVSFFRAAPE